MEKVFASVRSSLEISVAVARTSQSPFPLCDILIKKLHKIMDKIQILNFLTKYNFKYSENTEVITVNLDFAQKVILDFSESEKLKIDDRLTGWNFLTGLISMSLKHAIIYNFVVAAIIGILFINLQVENSEFSLTPFYLVLMLWILLFSGYYLVKLENFKSQIMNLRS